MGTPINPPKINPGDKIKDFIIRKKIGEGACGQVYLVAVTDKDGKIKGRAAMKIEPRMRSKEDEILKMEILVLKKMQNSRHACRCFGSGLEPTYTYLVMSLLGKEIAEIRKRLPNRKMSVPSTIRIGIQIVKALQDMHEVGFIHRDVKPSNLAMGLNNPQVLYIFDFGLARQIMIPDGAGKLKLREPRNKTTFRGTVRYCSLNVHHFKDQGRHDDLYGGLFSLIECVTGNLPWKGMARKDAAKVKEATSEDKLCKGCPASFLEIAKILKKLTYHDTPPYLAIMGKLKTDLPPKIKMTDPYEWNKPGEAQSKPDVEAAEKSEKAEADKDNAADQKTGDDVEDSVVTEEKESQSQDGDDFAKDDTLEGL